MSKVKFLHHLELYEIVETSSFIFVYFSLVFIHGERLFERIFGYSNLA